MDKIKKIVDETVKTFLSEEILRTAKGSPIKRYKDNVGKLMGADLYVHINYVQDILSPQQFEKYEQAEYILENHIKENPQLANFTPTIIKYNLTTNSVSFLMSRDFNTNPEPTINASILVKNDGTISYRKEEANPTIYHHKWTMVKDDFSGFDVQDSIERSKKWLAIPDLEPSKYGRRDYWDKNVVPNIK